MFRITLKFFIEMEESKRNEIADCLGLQGIVVGKKGIRFKKK